MFLRLLLLFLLSVLVIQFFTQTESFHPWNTYGTMAIKSMSATPTYTTRLEYNYYKTPFPYKNAKKTNPIPVSPITYRQINARAL